MKAAIEQLTFDGFPILARRNGDKIAGWKSRALTWDAGAQNITGRRFLKARQGGKT
jgi:hypothetical protein